MIRIQRIESLDLPELAPYRTMRRPVEHRHQGIFVAEGEKVVRRLLASHFTVASVLLPAKWVGEFEPLLNARPETEIPVFVAHEKHLLEQLVGFSMFQGVLAVGKIPASPSLEQILAASPRPHLFAAVDGLTNAENLGALVRNCAAFGVQALLVGETSSSPFLRRAVRNSMGAIFQLPVLELGNAGVATNPVVKPIHGSRGHQPSTALNLADALRTLRSRGIRCVAAHPRAEKKALPEADFSRDCCIVFGSEGYGLSAPVLEACDDAVCIPMATGVDSLNVGSAAAVFLYEVARQRGRM